MAVDLERVYTDEEIDWALSALVAYAGDATAAVRYLDRVADGRSVPPPETLEDWSHGVHLERYEKAREQWSGLREKALAGDMRDAAVEAVKAQRLAVKKAVEKLERDEDPFPASSAASLARVAQSNTDKMLALTGRPSTITEDRSTAEAVRSLVALGVFKLPDEPPAIEGSSDDER